MARRPAEIFATSRSDEFLALYVRQAQINMVEMVQEAVSRQSGAVDGMLSTMAGTFADMQVSHPEMFQRAHEDVGRAAMNSVASGFRQRRFKRPAGRYRDRSTDRLTGRLGKALSGSALSAHVEATPTSLSVLNVSLLDREAGHWRRLNFGAGGGSVEGIIAPQKFPIDWNGTVVGVLGLDPDPQPKFRMPKGFWLDGGNRVPSSPDRLGMDQFFLPGMVSGKGVRGRAGGDNRRFTRGIGSRNFVDAGVRRLSNELPRAYATIYSDLFASARDELEAVAAAASVSVAAPGQPNIRVNYRRGNTGRRR